MILVGGDSKEKILYRVPRYYGFCFFRAIESELSSPCKNKILSLSRQDFFFCRGGRIRTCDPLVPNQMR